MDRTTKILLAANRDRSLGQPWTVHLSANARDCADGQAVLSYDEMRDDLGGIYLGACPNHAICR